MTEISYPYLTSFATHRRYQQLIDYKRRIDSHVSSIHIPFPLQRDLFLGDTLNELKELASRGYIFRGQSNKNWKLVSSALRGGLSDLSFSDYTRLQDAIRRCDPECLGRLPLLLEVRLALLFRFQENYFRKLLKFYENNLFFDPPLFQQCIRDCQILFKNGNNAFFVFLNHGNYLNGFSTRTFENGQIDGPEPIINTLSILEETYAQHYYIDDETDGGTTLLDWTKDYRVAIYFAIAGKADEKDLTDFSIFAFNPLNQKDGITIIEGDAEKNERLKAQKGCFTRFKKCGEYFLKTGGLPTMENYCNTFVDPEGNKLRQYNLSANTVSDLQKSLKEWEIDEYTLRLKDRESAVA